MDYLYLEKTNLHTNWQIKLINASKINFIHILYSRNKVDMDYKENT